MKNIEICQMDFTQFVMLDQNQAYARKIIKAISESDIGFSVVQDGDYDDIVHIILQLDNGE